MQQFLDPPSEGRPRIAVDHREGREFDELLSSLGADVERRQLAVGDFICSSRLAVERKTRGDFEQSVIDGRLFAQLPNLLDNYERVVIIIEGAAGEERLSRESLMGAYAAVMADYGASLIFTRDMRATAELVFHLAKHEQLAKKQPMRIYAKRRTLTPSQAARAVVESLPMVGPKTAKALLSHFGSIEALARATEREMAGVEGIGKKKAKVISAMFRHPYEDGGDRQQ